MLGLADRSKLILLFREILVGDQKKAISHLEELIDNGVDAKNFLNDILELLYLFSRRINLGPIKKDAMISESEIQLIEEHTKSLNMQDLGLFWQLTIKTIDDLKVVANENLTLEMYIMQLIHLKDIGQFQEKEDEVQNNGGTQIFQNNKDENTEKEEDKKKITTSIKNQLKNTNQIKTNVIKNPELEKQTNIKSEINNFQDLINIANKEKEIELKYDLERNVKLVSFSKGKIDISFNDKLNKKFIKILTEKLLTWTGERWIISLSKNSGAKSVYEKNLESKSASILKEKKNEIVKKIFSNFPDAKLVDVKEEEDA